MMVLPRTNPATQQPYALDFNQIAVDPATGDVQGRREWGAVSLARLNLIPFIYKLHYTLQLPFTGGVDIGTWLMGIVGIVWLFDSVVALWLSFPSFKAWRKSFAFRLRRGGYALTFDLHRSGGVWIWGLLVIVALTSVSMNLSAPVVRPIVSMLSTLTPDPINNPEILRKPEPGDQVLSRERIVQLAEQAGRAQNLKVPPGGLYYAEFLHAYGVGFYASRQRSRRCGPRQSVDVLGRRHRQAARRADSRQRHGGRYLHAGAIPAALGTHPRSRRADSD